MRDKLGANDPTVQRALNGKTPAEAAKAYIDGTKLDDPAVRKQLYQGGAAAVAASTDPLIVLMRDIDPRARELRKQWDDKVDAVVRTNSTQIAKARFAVQGTNTYPDATFTLRLSYGTIKGYEEQRQVHPALHHHGRSLRTRRRQRQQGRLRVAQDHGTTPRASSI